MNKQSIDLKAFQAGVFTLGVRFEFNARTNVFIKDFEIFTVKSGVDGGCFLTEKSRKFLLKKVKEDNPE